ncbi:hypothetical protein [Acidovorax sp. NCPPB 4044]|uniref:hypothetical protein n=1 Tax=Acidovorax sp. NCPPB 4044 TaxID=2940490 RepID=UPI002302D92F|nr:hypothetical protein [Acidovorax sp. NCPPB 4044]MDA8521730.1 hypothetical protein [Acidovorax sp. NCPPB 4044]
MDFHLGQGDEKIPLAAIKKGATMTNTVAILMNGEVKALREALAPCMPVWIPDIFKEAILKDDNQKEILTHQTTWFPLREGETRNSAAARISFSLDDHYSEESQPNGYRCLMVFGAAFDEENFADYEKLGFRKFYNTDFGFIAMK